MYCPLCFSIFQVRLRPCYQITGSISTIPSLIERLLLLTLARGYDHATPFLSQHLPCSQAIPLDRLTGQLDQVSYVSVPSQVYQQIDITLLISFSSCNRTKNAHIRCAVLCCDAEDVLAFCVQEFIIGYHCNRFAFSTAVSIYVDHVNAL